MPEHPDILQWHIYTPRAGRISRSYLSGEKILFGGLVLVGARHSTPHWAACRPNAECATVGYQNLPFWGQILGSKLWTYLLVLLLLPFSHICLASLPRQTRHVSF